VYPSPGVPIRMFGTPHVEEACVLVYMRAWCAAMCSCYCKILPGCRRDMQEQQDVEHLIVRSLMCQRSPTAACCHSCDSLQRPVGQAIALQDSRWLCGFAACRAWRHQQIQR